MALLQLGVSICGICGRTIDEAGEAVLLGAFVVNASDPLYRFSDGVFHQGCFGGDPLGGRCLELWEQFIELRGPAGSPCAACGESVVDFRDHLAFGLLSSDPASCLYGLNYVQLHRSHVSEWCRVAEVLALLRNAMCDKELSGSEAERLVQDLESLGW